MSSLFSVPIFFIIFRETVEAGIIVSVLLSFVDQLVGQTSTAQERDADSLAAEDESESTEETALLAGHATDTSAGRGAVPVENVDEERVALARRLKVQIWAGAMAGLAVALGIGAVFLAIFYIQLVDLWSASEQLWEGVFSLLAAGIIFLMGLAFLRTDRARVKWRHKLSLALAARDEPERERGRGRRVGGGEERWALFVLPFITVIREGLEAVVFVGGLALNVEPSAIPLPTICALITGGLVGLAVYRTGATTTLHIFLIGSTALLFLIGAGLASKGVGFFEYYHFARGVGGDVAETGDGPGSFMVKGNIWHFECCNPEPGNPSTSGFWQLANSLVGWNNTATTGTVGAYMVYWLVIACTLVWLKWKEGRMRKLGAGPGEGLLIR